MLRPFRTVVVSLCLLLHTSASARSIAIPFDSASVESTDGSHYVVSWSAAGTHSVDVYASQNFSDFGGPPLSAHRRGNDRVSFALAPHIRWYFKLVPDNGSPLVLGDRTLHLASVANFRDVGGYRTSDGNWVRMGLAYRSNALDKLMPSELNSISALGIKLVCDLRTDDERSRDPDVAIPGAEVIAEDVMGDTHRTPHTAKAPAPGSTLTADEARTAITQAYREFVDLNSAQQAYHALFVRLADPAALPAVFHCTAGKDRTGWAQAVLLTILGVPRSAILADYILTNTYLAPQAELVARHFAPGTSEAATQVFLAADPNYLRAAFAEVHARFGSFDVYLHRGLKLDDATLLSIRRNFLTPARAGDRAQ